MKTARWCLLLLAFASIDAPALTIDEAYASIPHRRTPFNPRTADVPSAQRDSLDRLFTLTDQGVLLRVEGMRAQRARDTAALQRVLSGYDALAATLRAEKLAPEVQPARDLIVEALAGQRRYLASRPDGGMQFTRADLNGAPEVRNSSQSLKNAYGLLMKAFPRQLTHNRTAFFDHLCALDFL